MSRRTGPPSAAPKSFRWNWRDLRLIEVVAGIERAVAEELVSGAVNVVVAGCGDDGDLRAGALAVVSSVGVADDVEFAHGLDAKQLAAGAAGSDVDQRSAGVLDSVQQEEIVLRPASGDGKHVADGGV